MTQKRLASSYFFLLTALLLTMLSGCMNKSTVEVEAQRDEQLYIDAKLGFSILHPLTWDNIKIPVSSPEYRQDSIRWKIPNGGVPGTMDIRVIPATDSATELTDVLDDFQQSRPEHSSEEIVPYQHAIGDAIVTTSYYPDHAQRLFVIAGEKNTYILSFFASSEGFVEHLSLFEQIANSLRER